MFIELEAAKVKNSRNEMERLLKQANETYRKTVNERLTAKQVRIESEAKQKEEMERLVETYNTLTEVYKETEQQSRMAQKEFDTARTIRHKSEIQQREELKRLVEEYYSLTELYKKVEKESVEARTERETAEYIRLKAETMQQEEVKKLSTLYQHLNELLQKAETDRTKAENEYLKAEKIRRELEDELEWTRSRVPEDYRADAYDVLGVYKDDSLAVIKDTYKKLIRIYHPDKHPNLNELSLKQKTDHIARINASYSWILRHHRDGNA